MIGLFCFVLAVLASPFKSKLRLEAENAVLRHQLIVLRRRLHGRRALTTGPRIKPTLIFLRSARRPNPGRGSTYRRGLFVQTTGTSSASRLFLLLLSRSKCWLP